MRFRILAQIIIVLMILSSSINAAGFDHFITTEGYRLMDGDQNFRFLSYNIPNLNFIEDAMDFERSHPFALPTAFEMRDAMESVRQTGGNVIRIYTIPVRRKTDTYDVPRYVLAPGEFCERAFVTMDTMLALANETGVRLILPLLNAWKWMGGRPQYAAFRGKTAEDFWTDPQLIDDFKKTIRFVITRTNTVTGIPYSEDKSILCWETGNELPCPHSWTKIITTYIKTLDANHLVMDGYNAINQRTVREEALTESGIDIVTSHHYETNPADVLVNIESNLKVVQKRKPYIIGEFGFLSTTALTHIIDYIIKKKDVAGGLIWSLRYHRHDGGFYWHSEPLGYGLYKAYHWPGFDSGNEYDEKNLLAVIRQNAFAIQGNPAPPVPVPESPLLLPVSHVASISWQGSVGAGGYDVERAESPDGPWKIVGYNISDAAVQYHPIFHDASAELGSVYYYRVIARNQSGKSMPSNIAGPVRVQEQSIIDEMENRMVAYHMNGDLTFQSNDDRKFKEDMVRLQGEKGSCLIYQTPGSITRIKIFAFAESENPTLSITAAKDNHAYSAINIQRTSYFSGTGDYAYWRPVCYESNPSDKSVQYIKIEFLEQTQISRIEINYRE
ncbi:hypothetical protein JW835_12465 [bacterium]|nr:hypothetical protein [bacterium]